VDNLATIPNELDRKKFQCRAIIETPKGNRNKFDFDPKTELFKLGGLLPVGMVFPYDFGFIPSTLGEDGDPLDVMIMMEEPGVTGCLVDIRLVGVIEAVQTEDGKTESNDRLIAVPIHSYSHEDVTSIDQLSSSVVEQIEQFFISYNKQRGKKFQVKGRKGPKRALALVEAGIKLAKQKA
jgi:inorganic pyrophosphatase